MTQTIAGYNPERVRPILEFVRELKRIAYAYANAPDPRSRAQALKAWRTATAAVGVDARLEATSKPPKRRCTTRNSGLA